MTRAVIYARYSSDMQSDASIEDQIVMCQGRATGDACRVIQSYTDHAISGASMMRPGIQMLMQDAAEGKFDVLYAEALDRISRDQEDIAAIFKRLSFAGVRIMTLSEGEISHLHIGLKGTMNAIFLKDLADKTRRGLRGRVRAGKSGGGTCYGYDVVHDGDERGGRAINEVEAAIVCRIFEEYASGKSPKAIAIQLNKEKIAGPTGKGWGQSTINGNRHRGTGILNNELYIGRLVWNRLRYIKDPETGKRISRPNPEEQWEIQDVPELRIVDQELWDRVKGRQKGLSKATELWQTNRPRSLFSSLIKCGVCGGGCSTVSTGRIGCSTARNKGTCDNRQTVKREVLEEAVLGALKEHLMDPELCKVFCEEYTRHRNELSKRRTSAIHGYRAELDKLERERKKLVQSILNGVPGDLLKDDANRINDRKKELERILDNVGEEPVIFHPNMADRYRIEVTRLIDSFDSVEHRSEASELIRSLVDSIVLTPSEDRDRPIIDVIGDLAGILSVAADRDNSTIARELSEFNPDECEALVAGGRYQRQSKSPADHCEALVAGVGFEPTTFRL